MEIKKSHKADLEHWRPWMFLAGIVIMVIVFFLVLEVRVVANYIASISLDDEINMDLNIKPKDDRDLISAEEKKKLRKEEKKAEKLHKVDKVTEAPPEIIDKIKFEPPKPDEELTEKEPPININDDDPETLRIVQELPQYPGGMVEFVKWLTDNLRYPPTALRNKIEGKVMISFIVNTDGSLSELKVEQSVHRLLDNEALRVARLMPNWKPGKDHGKICRTKVAIPIVFAL